MQRQTRVVVSESVERRRHQRQNKWRTHFFGSYVALTQFLQTADGFARHHLTEQFHADSTRFF